MQSDFSHLICTCDVPEEKNVQLPPDYLLPECCEPTAQTAADLLQSEIWWGVHLTTVLPAHSVYPTQSMGWQQGYKFTIPAEANFSLLWERLSEACNAREPGPDRPSWDRRWGYEWGKAPRSPSLEHPLLSHRTSLKNTVSKTKWLTVSREWS